VTSAHDHGISTHVLSTASGLPAAAMQVRAQILRGDAWIDLVVASTDADGRIKSMLHGHTLTAGTYRLIFASGEWFAIQKIDAFFPTVTIEFQVTDPQRHHHVPLLLSPFGYSTYRGT